jgi:hypothetical protein
MLYAVAEATHVIEAVQPELELALLELKTKVSEDVLEMIVPGELLPENCPITGAEVVDPS